MAIPRPYNLVKVGGSKSNILSEYNDILNMLEKNVFHSTKDTTDDQLENVGKKLIGTEFGGVYPEDENVLFDKKHKYYIFNTDKASGPGEHWLAIYVDHPTKRVIVFDTFNRETSKLVPDLYLDIKKNHMRVRKGAKHIHQKDCELNCGERSMSYLLLVKKFGIEKVLDSTF